MCMKFQKDLFYVFYYLKKFHFSRPFELYIIYEALQKQKDNSSSRNFSTLITCTTYLLYYISYTHEFIYINCSCHINSYNIDNFQLN